MKSLNWSERVNENKQTKKAWEEYTKSPKHCFVCGSCIWPQPRRCGMAQARMQDCCSLSCASLLGAKRRGAKIGREKNEKGLYRKVCPMCKGLMTWQATTCKRCSGKKLALSTLLQNETLGELKARSTHWNWRAKIATWARKLYQRAQFPRTCLICDYDRIVDIAHVKAVASFPDETKLSEINALENLVALCPNHHWEFDNGDISEDQIKRASRKNLKAL